MRFWKVSCGNNFCGCDEEWLMKTNDEQELVAEEVMDYYSYAEGAGGISADDPEFDPESEEFEGETYEDLIWENLDWEEISEEEFKTLRDEELWEVRG